MQDRIERFLTAQKAPGWLLIAIGIVFLAYEVIDVLSNVEFVASHMSWLHSTLSVGVLRLAFMVCTFAAGVVWLVRVGDMREAAPALPEALPSLDATPSSKRKLDALYVEHDGARWQYGGFYVMRDEEPYAKPPVCPEHLSSLFYKSADGLHAPGSGYSQPFGIYRGVLDELWCPAKHGMGPHESRDYGEMLAQAEALLQGEYNRWKNE